eukprot:gene29258-38328_t
MPRVEEEVVQDGSVLEAAINFIESSYFKVKIDDFMTEHCYKFDKLAESKSPEDEEMNLEFTEVFSKYEALIDRLFDEFASKNKTSSSTLYQCCRDVAEGKFTALFAEHEHQWFVDLAVSWTSFDCFVAEMCKESRRRRTTRLHKK